MVPPKCAWWVRAGAGARIQDGQVPDWPYSRNGSPCILSPQDYEISCNPHCQHPILPWHHWQMPRTSLFEHLWLCLRVFPGHRGASCLHAMVHAPELPSTRAHTGIGGSNSHSLPSKPVLYSFSAGLQRDLNPLTPPLLAPSLFLSHSPPLQDMAGSLREAISEDVDVASEQRHEFQERHDRTEFQAKDSPFTASLEVGTG